MSMFEAVGACFQKYAVFRGRARRREYWFFNLFNIIIASICSSIANAANSQLVYLLFSIYELAVLIPSLAVSWRRMHDIGKPGTYVLLPCLFVLGAMGIFLIAILASISPLVYLAVVCMLAALICALVVLVWECRDGQAYANAYGPDPKGRDWASPSNTR